jgi:hypothetical protein
MFEWIRKFLSGPSSTDTMEPVAHRPNKQGVEKIFREYASLSGFSGQCDRVKAESAVTALYNLIDLRAPKFIWFDSPLPALRAMILWDLMEGILRIGSPNQSNRLLFSADAIRGNWQSQALSIQHKILAEIYSSRPSELERMHVHQFLDDSPVPFAHHHALISARIRDQITQECAQRYPLDIWLQTWCEMQPALDAVGSETAAAWNQFAEIFWTLPDDDQRSLIERILINNWYQSVDLGSLTTFQ